jgi:hypothetical protein
MNIFAQLPTDISKMIYRRALKIKHDEKLMRIRVFDEIKNVAHEMRRSKNVSSQIFDEYDIKSAVRETMEVTDGDDQFKFAILRRTCTIDACGTKIIIKYQRCHALVKNKNFVGHRKIPHREHMQIYRADGRSSKMLKSINVDFAADRLDIRARAVYDMIKNIAREDDMRLGETMMKMIS